METPPPGFRSAFLTAAFQGDLPLIKRLAAEFENGEGPGKISYVKLKTADGCNALLLAAAEGQTQTCRYLIQKLKFDINEANHSGETPLLQAILGMHWPTSIYLIENGADVTKGNNKRFTPLHYAAEKGSEEVVKLLISKGADLCANCEAGTPLHCAAGHGEPEALKCLLELKADPNSPSPVQLTPLLLSILAESLDCMELLLKAGADPNGRAANTTPLCFAASESDEEMISDLLKAGADPNMSDSICLLLNVTSFAILGITPLEHAALNGFREVVTLLFPVTSRIASYPDWSINGVMQHVHSAEARAQRESKRKELFLLAKAKGGDAFQRKDYLQAMYWYSQAVEADRSDAKVLANRSLCWVKLNEGDPALSDAQACVQLEPDWAKAHYREGAAWKLLKNYAMAAKAFSRALSLDPGNKEIEKEYWAVQAAHANASN